jgi:hypothetical protein
MRAFLRELAHLEAVEDALKRLRVGIKLGHVAGRHGNKVYSWLRSCAACARVLRGLARG